jgi:hypothetical protein
LSVLKSRFLRDLFRSICDDSVFHLYNRFGKFFEVIPQRLRDIDLDQFDNPVPDLQGSKVLADGHDIPALAFDCDGIDVDLRSEVIRYGP